VTSEISPTIYTRENHSISRKSIDTDALKILYRLMRHGFKAYLVGGGVRDLLLGIKPKDYDIGTDAHPRQIKSIFRNSRIIGRRFKLVHIYFHGGKIIEVATFRAQDVPVEVAEGSEGEQELPPQELDENIYGSDATDAFRRDLSINGLFYDLSTFSVIDYVGGMKDLESKLIRIIGNPKERFAEDPVRLIRVLRHAGRTGFEIEPKTYKSLVENIALIKDASNVRVYEEFKKDLSSGHSAAIIKLMLNSGLLECLLPDLTENNGEFFSEENQAAEVFSRTDAIIKDGESLSSTSVLAAISLFIGLPNIDRSDLFHRFTSKQELSLHLQGCFHSLAVPRREREKLQHILNSWFDLKHTETENIKFQKYRNKDFLADLIGLIKIIGDSDEDQFILNSLTDLESSRNSHGNHESRGRRRRSRHRNGTSNRRRMM
jgi:poly(A) polymerase